jgi:hypothetical protein
VVDFGFHSSISYRLSIQRLAKRALVYQRLYIIFGIGFYVPFEHTLEFVAINLALLRSSEMQSHS